MFLLWVAVRALLFLIYINNITDDLESNRFTYADDTTLLEVVNDPVVSADYKLINDLIKISEWSDRKVMTMNPIKNHSRPRRANRPCGSLFKNAIHCVFK